MNIDVKDVLENTKLEWVRENGKYGRIKRAVIACPILMVIKAEASPQISLEFRKLDFSGLVTFAGGTVTALTGNTDLPNPTKALSVIATLAGNLDVTNKKKAAGDKSTTTTKLQKKQATLLMNALEVNAHYVLDTAKETANGDLVVAEKIILSSGYKLKPKAETHSRTLEVVEAWEGGVHFRVKKVPGTKGSLWRYGITTAKNVKPTTLITHHTLAVDAIIDDLPSGSIVGLQHAESQLTPIVKKYKHPTFSHNTPDPYDWSDFIYVVVP